MSEDREIVVEGLPVKKQFLTRAFFPFGAHACKAIGIMPASTDVQEYENHQAQHEVMAAGSDFGAFILSRVEWYMKANEALVADHPEVQPRTLDEHLAAFTMAMMVEERLVR